jgi:FlaA1/EpsC-like NDP-sugar epimerase
MKVYNIKDIASKISKKYNVIGLRQGEKLSEVLITESEKSLAIEKNNMWIINHYTR